MSYPASNASPYSGLSPMDEVTDLPSPIPNGPTAGNVSNGTNGVVPVAPNSNEEPGVSTTESDTLHQLTTAQFEKQPPDNMRKSNFFNFIISMYDGRQQGVEVQKATFKDFYDTSSDGLEYRNGLIYKLLVRYRDGVQREEDLYVRLIDSSTKQLIPYEGTCKNPDFRRVLLTHELICSRCLEHRSCGNKNDTPSDPILVDSFRLKFFVKCNQNCLKNAGNPKDSRRRFQVALFCPSKPNPIACSDAMFVHNNSKHGRGRPTISYRDQMIGDGKPYIIAVYPSEGLTTGGTRVCIVGMNFYEGMEVVFGTLPATADFLSPNALAVRTPLSPRPGEVDITLVFKGNQFCITNPGKFYYTEPDANSYEHNFARLERLLRNQDDVDEIPKDILLRRSADALETFYALPRPPGHHHHMSPLVPKSPALIFTPHISQLFGGGYLPPDHGGHGPAEGSTTSAVSRCSSSDTVIQSCQPHSQHGIEASNASSFFTFPPMNSMSHHEIKHEVMNPQGIHKPKPITPGLAPHTVYPTAVMPFIQFTAPMHGHYPSYPSVQGSGGMPDPNVFAHLPNGEASNRNNNNSTAMPIHFIPQSPGFFIHPTATASPGPLPATPTGPGSSSVFNFNTPPLISPSKPFRHSGAAIGSGSKGGKPVPLSMPNTENISLQSVGMLNYPTSAMLAALPSPNFPGAFLFPPTTPTGQLIAPISLPDLSNTGSNAVTVTSSSSTTSSAAVSEHQEHAEPPPAKRPKEDGTSSATMSPNPPQAHQ